MNSTTSASHPPLAELTLLIGIPLLALIGGAIMFALAAPQSFTALAERPAVSTLDR